MKKRNGDGDSVRSFWRELLLAVAPVVAPVVITELATGVREYLRGEHRPAPCEPDDPAPPKGTPWRSN